MELRCDECIEEGDRSLKKVVYANYDKNKWLCGRHNQDDINRHLRELKESGVELDEQYGSIY